MTREWKPGDVALARSAVSKGGPVRAMFVLGGGWRSEMDGFARDDRVEVSRPLVVIDPESDGDVDLLLELIRRHGGVFPLNSFELQDALREYADPTPPKPAEPQGLGAVVEDIEGGEFVRAPSERYDGAWLCLQNGLRYEWADLEVVHVLSPGYTPNDNT